jgi:hypothetical protein
VRPKFSWSLDENSDCLLLLVDHGDRKVSWKVAATQPGKLAKVFREVAEELNPTAKRPAPPGRVVSSTVSPKQDAETGEVQQQSEEASMDQLAAKAAGVTTTGKDWFANMQQDSDELPLFTLGHGGEPQ